MKLTLSLKNKQSITFAADDKQAVVSLLSQWMENNSGFFGKLADCACDGLAIDIGEDEDEKETVQFVYTEFFGGHKTQVSIESGHAGCEPYDVEEFGVDWDAARMRFLELALEHGEQQDDIKRAPVGILDNLADYDILK